MNKFLNRKNKPEAPVTPTPFVTDLTRSVTPSQLSPGIRKSQSKWKKNKRVAEVKQQEFNLNNALPSVDDFRTSLIMPNLSARFSMLREQDDPKSMLGKAMDDSVLQPRRRSRMVDFGGYASRGALGDIAEVSSIRSSIRPPFANNGRGDSMYDEGYDSDPNSSRVMSRARPGEGNVMFGGRQRIHLIPKSASARSLGKVVYEDDIGTSAFQKFRQQEREAAAAARMTDEAQHFDFGLQPDEPDNDDSQNTQHFDHPDLNHSPSLSSYEKKRSTNSSSARSEARSSTAATSVASQPLVSAAIIPTPPPTGTMQSRPSLERSNTKGRRLYEPALDQHIYEQQNSAMTRLNSIQRQRAPTATRAGSPYLHQTKSAGNLQDPSLQRSVYAMGTQSPPLGHRPAPLTGLASLHTRDSQGSPSTSGPASPLSPQNPAFDDQTVLSQAIEPADRGKATAMGAFNKPKQPFDEKQYLERQLALQRSTSSAAIKPEANPAQSAFQQRIGRFEENSKGDADRSRSRSKSKGTDARHPAYQGSAARNPNRSVTPSQFAQFSPQMSTQYSDAHRTFFGNIAASDSEDDDDDEKMRNDSFAGPMDQHYGVGKWQPSTLPSVSEHPALRSQRSRPTLVEEEEEDRVERSNPPSLPQINTLAADKDTQVESPTLGENLSGMINHLRQRSNASSMYPGDELPTSEHIPELPSNASNLHAYGSNNPHLRAMEFRGDSTYSGSNPWDLEDTDHKRQTQGSVSPMDDSVYGSRVPNRTAAQRDFQGQSQMSEISGVSQDSEPSWQSELRKQSHQRDTSSATQQERAAFDNELAARRAAIQDNIKSIVETERSNSPQIPSGPFKALGMLRTKTSRESMDPKRDTTRSLKSFVSTGGSSVAPSPTGPQDRSGFSFDMTRPRGDSVSRPPMPNNASQVRALHSEQERRDWSGERKTNRSPSSSNASQGGRSRSNSATTTGRSRSHTGPYRDDLEKAMMEGSGSSAAGLPDLISFIPKELTPRPSPEILSSNFEGNRARSASRAEYFDAQTYQPVQSSRKTSNSGNGAVPQTLTSAVYAPPASVRSSPAVSPFIQQTATPPLSGASTPLNATFSPMPTAARPLRKKTISKSEISEPTLLSWTSNIDTVDLPPGASLKNGMAEPPPVPPINPKRKTRKIFGKSTDENHDGRTARSKTPDPWVTFDNMPIGNGSHVHPAQRGYDSPATNGFRFPSNAVGSPERVERQAAAGAQLNGSMF